jgi:hypothetical membrane protein
MKRDLSFISSIFGVGCYIVFTIFAFIEFPAAYSPLKNWLSDLGSYILNPGGAHFYNIGIIIFGFSVLLFFVGLSTWGMSGKKIQKVMLRLTQIFGGLGAVSLLLSAIFPINIKETHAFLSASLYILIGTGFAFSVAALRYYSRYPRWLLFLGIFVAVEDMVWGMVLNTYIVEWFTVALFLCYILLVGIETKRKEIYLG